MLAWTSIRNCVVSASFGSLTLLLSVLPATADPGHHHHEHRQHERQWRRHHPRPYPVPLAVAPPGYYIAPAPVVMVPPPSVNIIIPLR